MDFLTSYELHKNKSKCIIPIALQAYFTKNIQIADTIQAHRNIFDFCCAKKASKDYYYEAIDRKTGIMQQYNKLIRYYMSTEGEKMYKVKHDYSEKTGPKISQCEASSNHQVMFNTPFILNNFAEYKIDYKYYIQETMKIISKILPEEKRKYEDSFKQQLKLF